MTQKQTSDEWVGEMTQKRSVIKWTHEQHKKLHAAAEQLGQTVPAYCKVAALEKANGRH
jgi:hypothetical protein